MFLIFRKPADIISAAAGDDLQIKLSVEESRHVKARRLKPGDVIFVADGLSLRYQSELTESYSVRLLNNEPEKRTESVNILYTAIPEGKRLDFLIQKATELLVTKIVPIHCERSVREKLPRERLERIIEEAAVQSGRFMLPSLHNTLDLSSGSASLTSWENSLQEDMHYLSIASAKSLNFVLHPYTENTLNDYAQKAYRDDVIRRFFVGPEGGFTSGDIENLIKIFKQSEDINKSESATSEETGYGNITLVSMGQSILRVETAGIACLARFL